MKVVNNMTNIVNAGQQGIILSNSEGLISDEVKEYVTSKVDKELLTKEFWDDFVLGASMYGISVGYTGAL